MPFLFSWCILIDITNETRTELGGLMQGKENIDSLLAESFKSLVLEEPIEKITIKEITDRAGVIRPTFYNHFQDKYELLESIIRTDIIDPVKPLMDGGFINESLVLIFKNLYRDKAFYAKACKLEGQNSFAEICQKCIEELLIHVMRTLTTKSAPQRWLTLERLAQYYAYATCYVVTTWIKSGFSSEPEEMAEIYQFIFSRSLQDVIEELK